MNSLKITKTSYHLILKYENLCKPRERMQMDKTRYHSHKLGEIMRKQIVCTEYFVQN